MLAGCWSTLAWLWENKMEVLNTFEMVPVNCSPCSEGEGLELHHEKGNSWKDSDLSSKLSEVQLTWEAKQVLINMGRRDVEMCSENSLCSFFITFKAPEHACSVFTNSLLFAWVKGFNTNSSFVVSHNYSEIDAAFLIIMVELLKRCRWEKVSHICCFPGKSLLTQNYYPDLLVDGICCSSSPHGSGGIHLCKTTYKN